VIYCMGRIPLRNIVYEKILQLKTVNDNELLTMLEKEGVEITESKLNKILLDLEILGFIRVGWITKDRRRIEYRESKDKDKEDSVDEELSDTLSEYHQQQQ
jgi:arginine repressor